MTACYLTNQCTHVTGLEVGFLGADQERCVGNGCVSVLHLLILLFVFVLTDKNNLCKESDIKNCLKVKARCCCSGEKRS